ncbi:hypothetical protein DFH28DRAFT_932442 [Melampsora americana]|nr:hypothetical protein DFH28DRAFT_932442 [Melampsora americana]
MMMRVGPEAHVICFAATIIRVIPRIFFHGCLTKFVLRKKERSTSNIENSKEIPARPLYNLLPQSFPNDITNRSLYAGRSTKPIPIHLAQPERWQRGAQFLAVTLSLGIGVWGVLFADFGNNDRETVFSPIRRWFAPYKASIFSLDEQDRKILASIQKRDASIQQRDDHDRS